MDSSSDSEDNWEEVVEEAQVVSSKNDELCHGVGVKDSSLEIVVSTGNLEGKRKLICDTLKRALASAEREAYLGAHKTQLLCLLAHGMYLSHLCSTPILQALILSLIAVRAPGLVLEQPGSYDKGSLLKLVKWVSSEGECVIRDVHRECKVLKESSYGFIDNFQELMAVSKVMVLVSLLRVLGLRVRLVMVLGPLLPLKPPSSHVQTCGKIKDSGKEGVVVEEVRTVKGGKCKGERVGGGGCVVGEGFGEKLLKFNIQKEEAEQSGQCSARRGGRTSEKRKKEINTEVKVPVTSGGVSLGRHGKKLKRQMSEFKGRAQGRANIGGLPTSSTEDLDFVPQPSKKRRKSLLAKATPSRKPKIKLRDGKPLNKPAATNQKSSREVAAFKEGSLSEELELMDVEETGSWVEVYLSDHKRWMCLHLASCSLDQPVLCEKYSLLPLHYVLAFEHQLNNIASGSVSDVTARYASGWCTNTRKQRVDESWWEESLRPYRPDSIIEVMEENEDIASRLSSQPLPLSISDYKKHPLYVLRRHLLKFEALYPEDSEVVGTCKGEAVYFRKNVHKLHTTETWLKEGRSIRSGEEPYGIVKARPKNAQNLEDAKTCKVYGRWQTEDYVPSSVADGQVPRNEYGNVNMFKPSMLPVGGAHIKVAGIQKVARKLGIDHAPAMVGWDFHGRHCYPVLHGVVVAKEFEDILLEAWETEQQIMIEKEMKKREKRVLNLWRKLVRGILIRNRVQEQFDIINS